MKIEIKHRVTNETIYSTEAETVKQAVIAAVNGGAKLRGAYLSCADLRGAYLGGAYLGGANLGGADLGGAYLYGANLYGANLGGADLYGAYLYGANLGGAYLYGANLGGADLGGANLHGAKRYSEHHAVIAEVVRQNTIKLTVREQEIVFRIVGLRLCWDSIRKEYGKTIGRVFRKLAALGYDEWQKRWEALS